MREPAYKKYLLAVLLVILAFNYVDRLAIGIAMQNIKADLSLSDTQLGVLTGLAFALFYSVMGIPLARWADRGNRVGIISLTTALWSVAVAICGLAGSFWQLALIRVGVAVGEAGCIPPAHSLIADYFTRAERARALSVYSLGGPLSMIVGYIVAGWLNELYGWRAMFMMIGLPGLGLSLWAWLGLHEPRGRALTPVEPRQPSLSEGSATLWKNSTYRHLLLCFSVVLFFTYGITQWQPAFFMRSYGLKSGQLGTWFALVYGFGGLAGTYAGGEWATRYAACNEPLQLKAMAVVLGGFAFISSFIYLFSNLYVAFAMTGLAAVGGSMINGPLFAIVQTLVPQRLRAMSIAFIYLFANLVGMGLGPLAAGALSDRLRPWAGEESLRYALLLLCPGYLWASWHLWSASKTVKAAIT
jgi:MFS family permease